MKVKEDFKGQKKHGWRMPMTPIPKIATCASVRRALPHYVTYPEFVALAADEIKPSRVPARIDALRACKTITAGDDFLAVAWMRMLKSPGARRWSQGWHLSRQKVMCVIGGVG